MLFKYKSYSVTRNSPSMFGRLYRVHPTLSVSVIGPQGSEVVDGLLDTGADETVFSVSVAKTIGLDLSNAPSITLSGVGKVASTLRFAQVTLRIANGGERREWQAWVGFTSVPLKRALLGFGGFLQFFTATFHGDREEVALTVNALYPGT